MSIGTPERRRLPDDFEEDPRYRVSVREARIVIVYWVVFTVALTAIAWGMGGGRTADEITFVWGIPAWFFWSGIVAAFALSLVPAVLVRSMFTDVPLAADANVPGTDEAPGPAASRPADGTGAGS